jgi:hypothetical protein
MIFFLSMNLMLSLKNMTISKYVVYAAIEISHMSFNNTRYTTWSISRMFLRGGKEAKASLPRM